MELGYRIYTHDMYVEQAQHWCPESETFAAASQLISALRDGWTLALPNVRRRQVDTGGSRPRVIYDFTLVRDGELMIMPVLANPYIERFIIQQGIGLLEEETPEAPMPQPHAMNGALISR